MTDLAVDDEDGSQRDEAAVVRGLLLPARQRPPEAVAPPVRHRHHPAPRRMAVRVRGGSGLAALAWGGMCGVSPRATAASRPSA
ncbi:MAG: hypothetical protein ACRDJC_15705 [Thermomicrobiales bacterium]